MRSSTKRLTLFLVAVLVLKLCAFMTPTVMAAPVEITAKIIDANFREAICSMLDKAPTEKIFDTDVAEITHLEVVFKDITALTGLEHFTSLIELNCSNNKLTNLPALPSSLTSLNCDSNELITLPKLPSGLEDLSCRTNSLKSLPALPSSLTLLNCDSNELTALPVLPSGLEDLSCQTNSQCYQRCHPACLHLTAVTTNFQLSH